MGDPQQRRIEVRVVTELARIAGMVLLALAQVTLIPAINGLTLPLVLLVLLSWLLVTIEMTGTIAQAALALRLAFYGGLALDLFAAMPVGSHALALMLAMLLVSLVCNWLRVEMLLLALPLLASATLTYELTLALLYHLTATPLVWQSYTVAVLLPATVLALPAAMGFYLLVRWTYRS